MTLSPERIWALCLQIKAGIETARDAGVVCEMPKTVEIDGFSFHFSTDLEDWRRRHKRFSATPETRVEPDADVASKAACSCKHSDTWRCAVARGLSSVSCGCRCHRATANC